MKLVDLLPKTMLVMDLKAKDKKGTIRELVGRLVAEDRLKEEDAKKVEKAVNKRESQGSTGIGKGLAIPHAKDCSHISQILGVFARSANGVSFDAVDGGPVHLIFLVVSPESKADDGPRSVDPQHLGPYSVSSTKRT